jgi:hypothetical protein
MWEEEIVLSTSTKMAGNSSAKMTKDLEMEIELLREEMPKDSFMEAERELEEVMIKLDKAYDNREKLIERIMERGTGYESRKALRMLSVPLLEKLANGLSRN